MTSCASVIYYPDQTERGERLMEDRVKELCNKCRGVNKCCLMGFLGYFTPEVVRGCTLSEIYDESLSLEERCNKLAYLKRLFAYLAEMAAPRV